MKTGKLKILIYFIGLISFIACENKLNTRPILKSTHQSFDKEFEKKMKGTLLFPVKEDWVKYNYIIKKISNNKKDYCDYHVEEKETVADLNETHIKISIQRTSSPDNQNPADCLAQPSPFLTSEEKSWTLSDYQKMKLLEMKQFIIPKTFKDKNSGTVQSVIFKSSKDLTYKKIPSTLYELEILTKKGKKYLLKTYISLNSIFLGAYEHILTSDDQTQYELDLYLKGYSLKNIGTQEFDLN